MVMLDGVRTGPANKRSSSPLSSKQPTFVASRGSVVDAEDSGLITSEPLHVSVFIAVACIGTAIERYWSVANIFGAETLI